MGWKWWEKGMNLFYAIFQFFTQVELTTLDGNMLYLVMKCNTRLLHNEY